MSHKKILKSIVHLLVGIIHARGAILFFLLLTLFSLNLGCIRGFVVSVLSVDALCLTDLIIGFTFHVVAQLLLVDYPTIVLTVMSMAFMLFGVSVGR
jgi:hypothetical protein